MAYECPRCGGKVERGSNTAAGIAGGLVGALLVAAFGAFNCKSCGKISRSEFPPDVQTKINIRSALLVVVAIAILIGVIALITFTQRR